MSEYQRTIRAATCFSGIGAPEQAMPEWFWLWSAEIDSFASAVLSIRHPESRNIGNILTDDFLAHAISFGPIDVLVGGPPCQAFSIAGLRNSLSDPRGNLTLRWVQVIHAIKPTFTVTENVPGWLSTTDNAFGCFLGALVGADDALCPPCGASWPRTGMAAGPLQRACWRILDAKFFGLAQQRERVFVVSSARDGPDPASILFESASLSGHSASRRKTGESCACPLAAGSPRSSGYRNDADTAANLIATSLTNNPYEAHVSRESLLVAKCLNAHSERLDGERETFITSTLTGNGDAHSGFRDHAGLVPIAFAENSSAELRFVNSDGQTVSSLTTGGGKPGQGYPALLHNGVRRLTPRECERLQGFPDDYTLINYRNRPASDSSRYKTIGNSMAVSVLSWILRRVEMILSKINHDDQEYPS